MGGKYLMLIAMLGLSVALADDNCDQNPGANILEFVKPFIKAINCSMNIKEDKFDPENLLPYWTNACKTFDQVKLIPAEVMVGLVSYLRPSLETLALTEIYNNDECIMGAINKTRDKVNEDFFNNLLDKHEEVYGNLSSIFNLYKKHSLDDAGKAAGNYSPDISVSIGLVRAGFDRLGAVERRMRAIEICETICCSLFGE